MNYMELTVKLIIKDGKLVEAKVEQPKLETKELASNYAKLFNESCTGWTDNPEYNRLYLKGQQSYANLMLRNKGYLFLNDVYDMLGLPRTKVGQIAGWVYDKNNPIEGDLVDFGLINELNEDFINGRKNVAWLDFNVDGNILDLIEKEKEG